MPEMLILSPMPILLGIAFCAAFGSGAPVIPSFDSEYGFIRQCAVDSPCPEGQSCMPDPFVPDIQACFPTALHKEPRVGSCPVGATNGVTGDRCQFDENCSKEFKCCTAGGGGLEKFCMRPILAPKKPVVTVLQEGSQAKNGETGFNFVGTITLVQADGKNILVDSGNTGQKIDIMKALQKRGLAFKDIDYLVTTHGHPDHFSNTGAMPDVPHVFGTFVIVNSNFTYSPLRLNKKFFLDDNENVEVVPTPGHTLQDNSLLVRNTPQQTVAVAGDLFLDAGDAGNPDVKYAQDLASYRTNRKAVVCEAAFIVPGHGGMFSVTEQMRKAHGC